MSRTERSVRECLLLAHVTTLLAGLVIAVMALSNMDGWNRWFEAGLGIALAVFQLISLHDDLEGLR